MSFASKLGDKQTPQTVWKELSEMGSKLMFTIPFKEKPEDMAGFCAVTGNKETEFPILTFCVEKPSGGCIVSTIIFPSIEEYSEFTEKMYVDSIDRFNWDNSLIYD